MIMMSNTRGGSVEQRYVKQTEIKEDRQVEVLGVESTCVDPEG